VNTINNEIKPLVFDVNVLIDAVDPDSPFNESAMQALSTNNRPIYLSDKILTTATIKLIDYGADPDVIEEYLFLLMGEREKDDPDIHVLEDYLVEDHTIRDRFGRHDYEDNNVASLVKHVENMGYDHVILIALDAGVRDWAVRTNRLAMKPGRFNQFDPSYSQLFYDLVDEISGKTTLMDTPHRKHKQSTPESIRKGKAMVENVRAEVNAKIEYLRNRNLKLFQKQTIPDFSRSPKRKPRPPTIDYSRGYDRNPQPVKPALPHIMPIDQEEYKPQENYEPDF